MESCGKHPHGGATDGSVGTSSVTSPPAPWPLLGGPNEHPKSVLPRDARAFCQLPLAYAVPPSPAQSHLEIGAPTWAGPAAPLSPGSPCICGMPAPREEESQEEVAGSALGGSGTPGGLVSLCLSPSHPVLVVFQGGVGSLAVLEELGVRWCPRTCALGWGTCALALQGIDSC